MLTRRAVGVLLCGLVCALLGIVWVPGSADAAPQGARWAVVSSAGLLVRTHGATSATRLGTGNYEVVFANNQTKCAYIATPGPDDTNVIPESVVATVAMRAGNVKGVYVEIRDQSTGALSDQPFHLVTYCGKKGNFAVIGADGSIARSSHVSVVSHQPDGSGHYVVGFDNNVRKCGVIATIGTTKDGSVVAPGEITVAHGTAFKSQVLVHTMTRPGVGTDYPFHIAVNCEKDVLTAVVDSAGSLVRGKHVVSAAKLAATTGQYEVIFDRDVTGCAFTATVGATTPGLEIDDPVTISTAWRSGNANGVFVYIHAYSGAEQNEPFHLNVAC